MSRPFLARLAEERAAPGAAAVLGGVRRAVLAGDAPPGTTVPLDAVAAVFGTSVIPVREALKTLVGEGLITQRPRGGYTVARLTAAELAELYVVRGLLEQGALAIATERATPLDHDRARGAHARLGAAQGDERAYHRESRAFHLALVAPSRMHRLQSMLDAGGPEVHLRTADLEPLVGRVEVIAQRVVVGMVAAAFIRGVGSFIGSDPQRLKDWKVQLPLLGAGVGTAGSLAAYLRWSGRKK